MSTPAQRASVLTMADSAARGLRRALAPRASFLKARVAYNGHFSPITATLSLDRVLPSPSQLDDLIATGQE